MAKKKGRANPDDRPAQGAEMTAEPTKAVKLTATQKFVCRQDQVVESATADQRSEEAGAAQIKFLTTRRTEA